MRISDWSSDVCSSDLGYGLWNMGPCLYVECPWHHAHDQALRSLDDRDGARFHYQYRFWRLGPGRSVPPRLLDLKRRGEYSDASCRGQFGKRGIRCNAIFPGFIFSPPTKKNYSPL